MSFGYCTGFSTEPRFQLGSELLPLIKSAGFDYVEFPLMNFYSMTESEFSTLLKEVEQYGLMGRSACNLFPSEIKLVGQSVDKARIKEYLQVVLERTKRLGVDRIILGSGKSRNYGNDQSYSEAYSQLADVIKSTVVPVAREYGQRVLIEPFERASSNLINTILDGLRLVHDVGEADFRLMVDLYHMEANGEDFNTIRECFPFIDHVHIAGVGRRLMTGEDLYIDRALLLLKELKYSSDISFETLKPTNKEKLSIVLEYYKSLMLN